MGFSFNGKPSKTVVKSKSQGFLTLERLQYVGGHLGHSQFWTGVYGHYTGTVGIMHNLRKCQTMSRWRKWGRSLAGILWLSFQSSLINMSFGGNSPDSIRLSRGSQVHSVQQVWPRGQRCIETSYVSSRAAENQPPRQETARALLVFVSPALTLSYHLQRRNLSEIALC